MLGEAFGAVRVFGQTLTGYRQLIDRPFINPQDTRMVPNTFEAYTRTMFPTSSATHQNRGAPVGTASSGPSYLNIMQVAGNPLPNRNETNVRVDYAFGKGTLLEGLVATLRYSWLRTRTGRRRPRPQLRAYVNYEFRF